MVKSGMFVLAAWSLFGLAGCDAGKTLSELGRPFIAQTDIKPTKVVIEPGALLSVDAREVRVYGTNHCPESSNRYLSNEASKEKCVIVDVDTKSVDVTYYPLAQDRSFNQGPVAETWIIERLDGDKVIIRSASGQPIAAAYRLGNQPAVAQFTANEGS